MPRVYLAAFQTPARTIMLGETGTRNDYQEQVPNAFKMIEPSDALDDDKDGRPVARHNQRVVLGFMDGHVVAMPLEGFYINQTPVDRWFTP